MKNEQMDLITKITEGSVVTEQRTTVFCEVKSATRSEFYAAYQVGLNPKIVFVVDTLDYEMASEYDEPTEAEYKGKKYNIIRSFKKFNETEVTCG